MALDLYPSLKPLKVEKPPKLLERMGKGVVRADRYEQRLGRGSFKKGGK